MKKEGPPLEKLMRRLAETPEDFLTEPRIGPSGHVHVAAVVGDLIEALGSTVPARRLGAFEGSAAARDRNRLSATLILCWLTAGEDISAAGVRPDDVLNLLEEGAADLAAGVVARKLIADPDRREEVARFALSRLGLRPAGETEAQAEDRLTAISSAERARVLRASREAEARARAIREALRKKAAEESADKWTRE